MSHRLSLLSLSLSLSFSGELLIGGGCVAAGYLHEPELTSQKFIKNPFGDGIVYRTGDVMKRERTWKGIYNYSFDRRIDDQVKLNGYRIELEEIENVYKRHPSIVQAVVLVRKGQLVLYVKLAASDLNTPLERLHEFARQSLTHYMMPTQTVLIDEFPQTANMKLDRKALPDPVAYLDDSLQDVELVTISSGPNCSKDDISINQPLSNEQKAHYKLSKHIMNLVSKISGKKTSMNMTFAQFGVDSLRAVMIIKLLSDNFGGIRLDPACIYTPGMTIIKFSSGFYDRLVVEKPDVLTKVLSEVETDTDFDLENRGETNINYTKEDCYDEAMAFNISLFVGIRGYLTFLVLWDHYSSIPTSPSIVVDTTLFFVVSGFTTSMQLRETARFDDSGKLQQKDLFNVTSFVSSRIMGIFPLLYVALLLDVPYWSVGEVSRESPVYRNKSVEKTEEGYCAFFYLTGMQTWFRSSPMNCKDHGPQQIVFASNMFNVTLMYAIFRAIFIRFQNYLISWRTPSRLNNIDDYNDVQTNVFSEKIGNLVTTLTYARLSRKKLPVVILCTVFFFGVLFISGTKEYRRNAGTFLPYFMGGVAGSWLAECILHNLCLQSAKIKPNDENPEPIDWHQRSFANKVECVISVSLNDTLLNNLCRFFPDMLALTIGNFTLSLFFVLFLFRSFHVSLLFPPSLPWPLLSLTHIHTHTSISGFISLFFSLLLYL